MGTSTATLSYQAQQLREFARLSEDPGVQNLIRQKGLTANPDQLFPRKAGVSVATGPVASPYRVSSMASRWGLTLPLPQLPLSEHEELVRRAEAAGYTDLWSGETNGPDGFTPLALAAAWTERARLGTGIVGVMVCVRSTYLARFNALS